MAILGVLNRSYDLSNPPNDHLCQIISKLAMYMCCVFDQNSLYIKSVPKKIIFLFLNQNICCGYSKEPSQGDGSFEHPKHMLKLMGKKIFTILRSKIVFISTYVHAKETTCTDVPTTSE